MFPNSSSSMFHFPRSASHALVVARAPHGRMAAVSVRGCFSSRLFQFEAVSVRGCFSSRLFQFEAVSVRGSAAPRAPPAGGGPAAAAARAASSVPDRAGAAARAARAAQPRPLQLRLGTARHSLRSLLRTATSRIVNKACNAMCCYRTNLCPISDRIRLISAFCISYVFS